MKVLTWVALYILALCLIVVGFEGKLGSFIAAFVAPAALTPNTATTG